MNTLKTFTERLNEMMAERDLRPSNLASVLGVPKNTICRYARGAQLPNLKMAIVLSGYFRCTIDYLLGRTDEQRKFIPQNPQPFKERFPILLEKFNTNKYRVAKSTALHQSVLYRWQSGDCSPELDSLIILADYFDCSVEYVIGRCETVW